MASKKVLTVGDKIDITKRTRDEIGEKKYVSKIQDFEDDDKIVISMPIEKNRYVPLRIGDKFETCFCTKNGLYKCKAEVIDTCKNGNQYYLTIQFMSELERYQRREYFRLEYVTDIMFSKIGLEYDENQKKCVTTIIEWTEATLTDISGGGMRFNSNVYFEGEEELFVKFSLGKDCNKFECICRANVVAITPLEKMPGVTEYRIAYQDISKVDRESIVKFVFEEERRRRNKNTERN